jgi:DNA-binding NarL/FixJ family response regulator
MLERESEAGVGVIRVLLVEGDQDRRVALTRALDTVPGIDVVGQVGDGNVATSAVMALNPDVVVLSAVLPTLSGPAAAELLARSCPQVRVLGLGGSGDAAALSAMQVAGAVGTVDGDAELTELAGAIFEAVTCA